MSVHNNKIEITMLASQRKKEQKYWLNKLSGELVKSTFSYDYAQTDTPEYHIKKLEFGLEKELFSQLTAASKGSDIKLNMVLATGLVILLWKYTGNRNIILGTSVLKQKIEARFVNTVLPLCSQVDSRMTFKELLLQVRQTIIEATENQNFPIKALLNLLKMPFKENDFPLFDNVIILKNIQDKEYVRHIRPNVIFSFFNTGESIEGEVEYNSSLYSEVKVKQIIIHFNNIVREALLNANAGVHQIEMLSPEEKKELLSDFNSTGKDWPGARGKTVHAVFAEQAGKSPDYMAVIYGERQLTYKTLNKKAGQLAGVLKGKGVIPDTIVGIMAERSVGMIVGILGILKAGGAYLPMESEYPDSRNRFMVEDSEIRVLVTRDSLKEKKQEIFKHLPAGNIISMDDGAIYTTGPSGESEPALNGKGDDMAYVIYTSGSTGKPKGVMVEHKNLINLVFGLHERIYKRYAVRLNIGVVSPYVFDASVKQVFGALLLGHCLHVVPEKIRIDGDGLLRYYRCYQVNISDGTPIHLRLLMEGNLEEKFNIAVKHFIIGGEPLHPGLVRRFFDHFSGETPTITNVYGPTECCVDSTSYEITRENIAAGKEIPIGVPMPNYQVYILNRAMRLLPIGVNGEICISGEGVARGYLKREELTAEKFDENPFNRDKVLYRTGDIGRWLPDGNIEFLGRRDNQVKIRGFRVELGEIENLLLAHEEIEQAFVIAKEAIDGDKYLRAFIVSTARTFEPAELRGFLLKDVPDYLIPLYFEQLDRIPLTPNGKVDRQALSAMEINRTGPRRVFEAPRDEVEEKLVKIWSELLEVDDQNISIADNFFELGGHSLKAAILVSRVHKVFNVRVSLADIFKKPFIGGLSQLIKGTEEHEFLSVQLAENKDYYALSPAQKRIYVLQQMSPGTTVYNIPAVMTLEGEVNKSKLEDTFGKLIQKHESLRTSFEIIDKEPVQRVHEGAAFEIDYYQVEDEGKVKEIIKNFVRSFELSKAPLLRVGLVRTPSPGDVSPAGSAAPTLHDKVETGSLHARYIFLVDMHHIISDGFSMKLFVGNFIELYEGKKLSPIKFQYKDYSQWKNQENETGALDQQAAYWREKFREDQQIAVLELPTDFARTGTQGFQGSGLSFQISHEETQRLKKLALEKGTTLYVVLLSAFNVFLSRITNQEAIVVGTVVAGRRHPDLERIMGMFVNTLGLINYPEGRKHFHQFIEEVKQSTLEAFENQDYPFEELVEQVVRNRDFSRNPLFDVLFLLQDSIVQEIEIPGLKLEPHEYENNTSKFDLTLQALQEKETLKFIIEYRTELFKPATIQRFINYYRTVLQVAANRADIKLSGIEMISAEEKNRLLFEMNATGAEYPDDKTIHDIFEKQVEKTPDRLALIGLKGESRERPGEEGKGTDDSISVTYKELDQKSNRLANRLREKRIQPDTTVGILMERSIEMVIGIFGILKAGGAYLPIDPGYPQDRISYMLNDSGAKILLTMREIAGLFSPQALNLAEGHHPDFPSSLSSSLAYVIYTSGSTGKPKGVMVEHTSAVNILSDLNRRYPFKESDVYLFKTSFVFDVSVAELFGWYWGGGRLAILEAGGEKDAGRILSAIETQGITHINFVPSMFNVFLEGINEENAGKLSGLKYIFLAGEALLPGVVEKFRHLPLKRHTQMENIYGPTEATIYTSGFSLSQWESAANANIPIGVPMQNIELYILDKYNNLQPVGIPGELCIAGKGLARGYLNRPELTDKKFFTNPLPGRKRCYSSGDLTRRLPDGNIEFLGRIDTQVKIRGYRIELGETENLLITHPAIKEAIVIDRENERKDKYLCAYIVTDGEIAAPALREFLAAAIPGYMIPSYFMMVERIPLTYNGKIDKKQLPVPGVEVDDTFAPPENETHEQIVEIWSDLLGIEKEKISIDANFFELGGHSLKAVQLLAEVYKRFNMNISMTKMSGNLTIRGLALIIDAADWAYNPQINNRQKREEVLL